MDSDSESTAQSRALSPALRAQEEDRRLAVDYCRENGLRYLSHERYGDELWVAVETAYERYEVNLSKPRGLSAAEEPCSEGVDVKPIE